MAVSIKSAYVYYLAITIYLDDRLRRFVICLMITLLTASNFEAVSADVHEFASGGVVVKQVDSRDFATDPTAPESSHPRHTHASNSDHCSHGHNFTFNRTDCGTPLVVARAAAVLPQRSVHSSPVRATLLRPPIA